MSIRTVSIGDIHGNDRWKDLVDLRDMENETNYIPQYDKYIFLGDYVDSFDKTNVEIIENLKDLISLKKKYPEHIILLIGNHDMQYISHDMIHRCTGHRPLMMVDLHELFSLNASLFSFSYQIESTIWTHGGITKLWYDIFVKEETFDKNISLSDNLNNHYEMQYTGLFAIGYRRGGYNITGGPLWADKKELENSPLPNYTQILGHNPSNSIEIIEGADYKLVFCDCLFKQEKCYLKTF